MPIHDDALNEAGFETATLSLFSPTNAVLRPYNPATPTIVDDDVVPAFRIYLPLVARGWL